MDSSFASKVKPRGFTGDIVRQRWKLKQERVKKGKILCVLGKDVTFDMVIGLTKQTLLWNFEYITMSRP